MKFNIFETPIESSTLKAWADIADDLVKAGLIGIATLIYSNDIISSRIVNILLLFIMIYVSIFIGRVLRQVKDRRDLCG